MAGKNGFREQSHPYQASLSSLKAKNCFFFQEKTVWPNLFAGSVEGGEGTGKDPAMGEDGSNQVSPAGDANKQLPTIFKYAAPQGTKEVFISGKPQF